MVVQNMDLLMNLANNVALLQNLDLELLGNIENAVAGKLDRSEFTDHSHEIADVTGLEAALNGRATDEELTALSQVVAGKAAADHTHNQYAASDHTHVEYAASGHNHDDRYPTDAEVTALVAPKADASAVSTLLALKANTSDVDTALGLKANTTDVNAALALKANNSNFVTLTQAAYDALATKDANTFYFIPEA
jgi:hypothetical protein